MAGFMHVITKMFDAFYTPFRSVHPFWGLLVMSAVTGFVMLFIFKYTTNQKQMKIVKDRIKMHFIELRLYQDDMGVVWKTQGRILKQNLQYVRLVFIAAIVVIIPVVFILMDMDYRFGHRPLEVGEAAIVKVNLAGRGGLPDVDLIAPEGVVVETPRLRIPVEREVNWRVHGTQPGQFDLGIRVDGQQFTKKLAVGKAFPSLSESSPPKDSMVESIEIVYPTQQFRFDSWIGHWLTLFCVFSLAVGFGLKGVFNIE